MANSLWGDFGDLQTLRTPSAILKEQAGYLSDMTKGLLRGVVENVSLPNSRLFAYNLDVIAPALNDYRYTVLSIYHQIELYPVEVGVGRGEIASICEDEAAFLRALKEIFNSVRVRSVIVSLMAQSQA